MPRVDKRQHRERNELSKEMLKCLRCGHTYEVEMDSKQEIKERVCPKCKSNSVRRMPQPT
jgi:predicted Zn-ribbon and HTH transcriptional regulator